MGISKIKNFPRGSAQNLEKSGGFAWRREGVLPSPRSGSGRGARRRNGLGAVFEVFLGGGSIWQVACPVSQMSLSSLLNKSTLTETIDSNESFESFENFKSFYYFK